MHKKNRGFTLIEILISMLLITISTLFLLKCMMVSLNGVKNSNLRFMAGQILENKKNSLLGMASGSPLLCEGERVEKVDDIKIRIKITNISEFLKKIILVASGKGYRSVSVFYRSEIIWEGKNE